MTQQSANRTGEETAMTSRAEKVARFRALHEGDRAFVIPNPWDRGSAILLEDAGFAALATTSAGFAFSAGLPDAVAAVSRDAVLAHVAEIVSATDLPVSADLEGGFADDPEGDADCIRAAAATGLAGGSIEDATGRAGDPLYDAGLARDRIAAAVEASRAVDSGFLLTARAENYLYGRPDLADTIARLQSFQEAGADVLYAPGLTDIGEIKSLIASVDRPVNLLVNAALKEADLDFFSDLGIRRISLGSLLARVAYGSMLEAVREISGKGLFTQAVTSMPYGELNGVFERRLETLRQS
jgi:2-methylisocitrate lyase-like PEP mutase family enzyme